jgi:4-amino-4-deoxy-L-arabinose transferase-like glycosyltransferase
MNWLRKQRYLVAMISYLSVWRLPSLFDKLWYLDENIYLTVGYGMVNGQLLYDGVWDNKPPLIYLIYACSYIIGGAQIWVTRLLGLVLAWSMVVGVYLFVKNVFGYSKRLALFGAGAMTILLTHGWETYIFNGELVFEPLILWGAYVLFSQAFATNKPVKAVLVGVLFALAAFTKIHAIAIILVLLTIWYFIGAYEKKLLITSRLLGTMVIVSILCIPYMLLVAYFGSMGKLDILKYSLYGFGSGYISYSHPIVFGFELTWLSGNLYRALMLAGTLIGAGYLYAKSIICRPTIIATGWLAVGTYVAFLSERAYPHYLISLFVPLALFVCIGISELQSSIAPRQKVLTAAAGVLTLQALLFSFNPGIAVPYYGGFTEYTSRLPKLLSESQSPEQYLRSFNAGQFEKVDTIRELVRTYSKEKDYIYVVANTPEIYPLTNRKPAYRQITDFQFDKPLKQVVQEVVEKTPSVIIFDTKSPAYTEFKQYLPTSYQFKEIKNTQFEAWVK